MVDATIGNVPTLNRTVLEFRALIESNNARRVAQEKTRMAKEALAESKLNDNIKKLEDTIKEQGKKAKQSDKDQLALLIEERSDRIDARIRQQEMRRLAQQTLGLSDKQFKEQQRANEEAKGARQRLEDLKTQLQSQGVDIKDNKNIQKLETEVARKERNARLKAMPLSSQLKEQGKDALKATGKQLARFLGPNSFFGKSIGGLLGALNRRFISPLVGGIGAILKGGTLIAFLIGLIEFLKSDIWKDYKEKLIPSIVKGLEATFTQFKKTFDDFFGEDGGFVKGFDGIMEDLFGVSSDSELSKGLKRFGASITRIFFGFFGEPGEGGKPGGILPGLKVLVKELGKAIGLVDPVTNEVLSLQEIFNPNNPVGMTVAIALLVGTFRKITGLIRAAGGIGTAGATIGTAAFSGKLTKDVLKVGEEFKSGGRTFAKDDTGRIREVVTDARGKKRLKFLGKGMTEADILSKATLPKRLGGGLGKNAGRILRVMGGVAKILPGIGIGLSVTEAAKVLQSDASPAQKRNQLIGIFGGLGGSTLGALLGGLVGGLVGPLGAFIGSLGLGIYGYFKGEQIATGLAQYALGEKVTAFDRIIFDPMSLLPYNLNKLLSGSSAPESNRTVDDIVNFPRSDVLGANSSLLDSGQLIPGGLRATLEQEKQLIESFNLGATDLTRSNGVSASITAQDLMMGSMGNIVVAPQNTSINSAISNFINNRSLSGDNKVVNTVTKLNNE